jgi:cation transport ATPase
VEQTDQIETRTEEQKENKTTQNQQRRDEVRRRTEANPIETQQEKEKTPAAAKEVEEYDIESIKDNPLAMALFAKSAYEEHERKEEAAKQRQERKKEQKKRKWRTTPEHLVRTMLQIVQYLGGNPKYEQSDITRMSKLYWACTQIFPNFSNAAFLDVLTRASVTTAKGRGIRNRVAYFFTCVEKELELSCEEFAYLRSAEPLYLDSNLNTFVQQMRICYERSGSPLDYEPWVRLTYHLS